MSSEISILAFLYPKAGKAPELIAALTTMSIYVKANEPGTLTYSINEEVNKKTGAVTVILIEKYQNQAAIDAHVASDAIKVFQKAMKEGDVLEKPMELRFVKDAGGFASRL